MDCGIVKNGLFRYLRQMNSIRIRLVSLVALALCAYSGFGQTAQIVKIGTLKDIIEKKSDKIQVINFWATWCAPCVKEMPLFEKINQTRPDVEVSLVSVDMNLDPNPAKVHKFVERKKLKSSVYILDE